MKLKTAIIGASGYTGEELLKYCLKHPQIELVKITSRQLEGKKLGDVLGFSGKGENLIFEN